MSYIQAIESIGVVLAHLSLLFTLVAAISVYMHKKNYSFLLIVAGLIVTEVGILFRIYGPEVSFVATSKGPVLAQNASLYVFLAKALVLPGGLFVAMTGFLIFSLKYKN